VGLRFVAPATRLGSQVWTADIPPQQLQILGDARGSQQGPSVILVREPKYDSATSMLTFEIDGAIAINVGTAKNTVIVGNFCELPQEEVPEPSQGDVPELSQAAGAGAVQTHISAIPTRVPEFNSRFFCRTQLRLR
jgi:hypothetical protein